MPERHWHRAKGAYAWVGPQPPYPKGPTNPLIISFKAWQLSETLESSFDSRLFCAPYAGFVKLETSTEGRENFRGNSVHAFDVMDLDLAPDAERRDAVLFNGSMVPDLTPEPSNKFEIVLPGSACSATRSLYLEYPEEANMTGSLTNTTLAFSTAGEATLSWMYTRGIEDARAIFNFTFTGIFDSNNSTRAVVIKQDTQPMVFWVDNGAIMYGPVSWMLKLIFLGWIVWFVSDG